MATEDFDITLENLLNLALGTPEIGAVNFNFLHEVIQEILKHLGISKKLARVTHEIDYRLTQGGSFQKTAIPKESVEKQSFERVKKTHPVESVLSTKQEKKASISETSTIPQALESKQDDKTIVGSTEESNNTTDAITTESSINKHSTESIAKKPSSVKQRVIHEDNDKKHSDHSQQSQKRSIVQMQRNSYITQRQSQLYQTNEGSINDAAIVKTMERRDSKTPAGDMWHVLNINRRVEAAEAAIQGMTNLIDTINSEVDEIKNNTSNTNVPEPKSIGSISKQEQDIVKKMAAKLKSYDGKFGEIEGKMDVFVRKDAIKNWCTEEQVVSMIKDNLDCFEPSFPICEPAVMTQETMISGTETTNPYKSPSSEISVNNLSQPEIAISPDKDKNNSKGSKSTEKIIKEVKPSEIPIRKVSTQVLKKNEFRESKTRIAYQEVSGKILFLEQEINKAKYKVGQLEVELGKKIEISHIEGKADSTEIFQQMNTLAQEIKETNEHVNQLEKTLKHIGDDVTVLVTQNDEFTEQQKALEKGIRKLERNLEDVTDNFHRSQSDIVRKSSIQANVADEVVITKIRGTIFDVQEQQTKFQTQIDSLLQDSKSKDKLFEELNIDITNLKEQKVDMAFLKRELGPKVDKKDIANKLNRDQFDACLGEIDRNIQAVLQKIEGTESFTTQSVKELEVDLADKFNRNEAKQIYSYIDTRFKTFKPKIQENRTTEEKAAATRKQLLKNCNCISCDRPVDLPISNDEVTLPCYQALPGIKSMRPVNTFDLQTIRQHMQQSWMTGNNKYRFELSNERDKLQKELLQLCGVRDLEELAAATSRACGGNHTMIEQHKRNPTKLPIFYREENFPCRHNERQLLETEVRGRDGHIYKGRMQSPMLPSIQRKDMDTSNEREAVLHPPLRMDSPIRPHPSSVDPQKSGNNFPPRKVTSMAETDL